MSASDDSRLDPWSVRETSLDLDRLGQMESLFALSNGHIGLRGNLDEGEPRAIPGTYLGSFHEQYPLPYAEVGYGDPEVGQTVVNVTNGKLIRLLVDDNPLDVRYGRLLAHERVLDLQDGTLRRNLDWQSPAGRRIRITSSRLVSFTQRAVAAIDYRVEVLDAPARVVVQSELVTNEAPPAAASDDPRVSAKLERPLDPVGRDAHNSGALLLHRTRASGLLLAAGMDHEINAPERPTLTSEIREDWARIPMVCTLQPGQTLRLVKYLGYGWSAHRSEPALRDQVAAALTAARATGWDGLRDAQRAYLERFWDDADVEIDGDPELQQATRFALFQMLQASARAEQRAIPAKGLTGPGYDGHAFWDTEGFLLPALALTVPDAAADALRWRASTLPVARARARTLDLAGAAFSWRTINGAASSGYWPAAAAALHLNADIARAVEYYRLATGDTELERECGLSVLLETARTWHSIGQHDRHGRWHIDGITGPDEYTALVDDNVFTNLMAARNLTAAADAYARHPTLSEQLGVTPAEAAGWRACSEAIYVPYDEELGVHPQCENFTRYGDWDFAAWEGCYPLMLATPYFQLYRHQVVKQADLVLALHWCGDAFTAEQKARNLDYYERRTVRDSSLSAGTQATVCAHAGHLQLAHDYLREAALMDLCDLHHNTTNGLHLGCLASAWGALVEGFGGLCLHSDALHLSPSLPETLTRLTFRIQWRGTRLLIEITRGTVRCSLPDQAAGELPLVLYDEPVVVTHAQPVERTRQHRTALLPPPPQPLGRSPLAGQTPSTAGRSSSRIRNDVR